ncbi:MAG: putative ACR [Ignavibacteriae bacterium]|nr:MAG: putative ACR [Ignavibacteriota bacterium]
MVKVIKNILMKIFGMFILLTVFNFCLSFSQVDRKPAVAGQFYPSNASELGKTLSELFSKAVKGKTSQNILALISPHAGYVYSGEVAASAFNQLDPSKDYDNIFLIGSSHHIFFNGASIYRKGDFLTPLGKVVVNKTISDELIQKYDFFTDREDAHTLEHSIEVEIPFLQYHLKKEFKIVPIVLGTQSPEICKKIANALKPYLNHRNLFVISTDYSHYPNYDDAYKVDKLTNDAILSKNPDNLLKVLEDNQRKGIKNLSTSLCGWTSVLVLLYMLENQKDISAELVQYKNSGDVQFGDKSRVVGYSAITFKRREKMDKEEFNLNDNEKKLLLSISRKTLEMFVRENKIFDVNEKDLTPNLKEKCGAFVTLYLNRQLRGCIGRFDPVDPLYKVVQQMTIASASEDYRFYPVTEDELKNIEIEISVLTPLRRIKSIDEIQLGKHGIYIKKGLNSGTFLPKVATETGWTKEEFLGHCAQDKAGIGWNGWKDAELYTYEALVFNEKEFLK